jgi:hypothetical protein
MRSGRRAIPGWYIPVLRSSIWKPGISRSSGPAVRRWSRMARSTIISNCVMNCRRSISRPNSDCEPVLHYYRNLRAGFRRVAARHVCAGALRSAGTPPRAVARPVRYQAALLCAGSENGIAFASEAQALLAAGFGARELRDRPIGEMLQLQFTTGAHTPFDGIQRVLPGETIVIAGGQDNRSPPPRSAAGGWPATFVARQRPRQRWRLP